jgi:general secretion pathway protein D
VGEKFITVIAEAQAGQQAAKFNTKESKDLPEAAQFITQVVQLKYVRPSQLTPILTPFQKNANAIVPFEDTGVLVIRDYAINVKRMLEVIEKVDVISSFDIVDEFIPIKYALAGDIAAVLGQLAGGGVAAGGGTRSTGVPGTPSAISTRRAGGSVSGSFLQPGAGGIGSVGGAGGIGQPGINQPGIGGIGGLGGTTGIGGATGALGGTRTDFQNRLTQLVQRATAGAGDFQLLGEVKIIPDERTNSLLVFATRADMDRIKDIVAKLDVVLAQVLIEALILDVNLADDFSLSFAYGQRPQTVNNNKIGGQVNNNGALSTGQQFLANTLSNGIVNYPAGGGISYFGSINDKWDMAVSALASDNNFKVLARPRVQTSHAVPANIFVGETRPYVTGTFFNGGLGGTGSSSQYQQTQIGLTLQVLPLINQEGLVVMDIQQQVQQIGGFEVIDGNRVPITQDENSSAKVAVRDRETIVLGGFIRDSKTEGNSGVPYLKDIPLLGYLFRSTTSRNERRELLVLIRPTVLATPEAAALKAQEIRTEMPTVNQVEKDIREREQKMLKKAPPPKTTSLK